MSIDNSKSAPGCSIIIRAYNEEKHIGRLLTGIAQQTEQNHEIILVDSGSTDRTIQIARQYGVQIVSIKPEEFSFGRALNRGISQAKGEFLVIASAHVYPVYPDWLERLLAPFSDPRVALTYGKQRGTDSSKFSEHQVFAQWFPDVSNLHQPYPFCNNANAAIRRSLWENTPYDEQLTGLEDLAWANTMMLQGYTIAYSADAEIIHVHNETPRMVYNRYRREAIAFKRIFPHQHFNLWDFVRLFSANTISDMAQAIRQKVFFNQFWSILWFRWMQFWGTYRGYHQPADLTWQLRQTFYYPRNGAVQSVSRPVEPIQYPK